jgi:hypothetical protein
VDIQAADEIRKYMYEVSSCRPAPAELDHRWCALQQTLEVITGESVSLTAPAKNHWSLAKAVV